MVRPILPNLRALHVSDLYANRRGDEAATRDLLAELTRAATPRRTRERADR